MAERAGLVYLLQGDCATCGCDIFCFTCRVPTKLSQLLLSLFFAFSLFLAKQYTVRVLTACCTVSK